MKSHIFALNQILYTSKNLKLINIHYLIKNQKILNFETTILIKLKILLYFPQEICKANFNVVIGRKL